MHGSRFDKRIMFIHTCIAKSLRLQFSQLGGIVVVDGAGRGVASNIKWWCMAAACSDLPCSFIHKLALHLHLQQSTVRPLRSVHPCFSLISSRFTCTFRPATWRWRFQFPPNVLDTVLNIFLYKSLTAAANSLNKIFASKPGNLCTKPFSTRNSAF
jgi:hypothetical protein